MSAVLVIEIRKEYPNDFDLTDYEGCDTIVEAAKLDKDMIDQGMVSFDEFAEGDNIKVDIRVLGEV